MGRATLAHPDLFADYESEIMEIVDNQLGHDYLSNKQFRDSLTPGGDHFVIVAFPDTAQQNPPVSLFYSSLPNGPSGMDRGITELPESVIPVPVGVNIGGLFDKTRLAAYLNISHSEYPSDLARADTVGVVRTAAVKEKVQRNGIGTELIQLSVDLLEQQDCDLQLGMAWRGRYGVHVHTILTNFGFEPVRELKNYWMDESIAEGYHCPICGPPPCRCSGVLYLRR